MDVADCGKFRIARYIPRGINNAISLKIASVEELVI